MAGTVIADRLEAASTSQLVIENGVALIPPTIVDVNNVQVGTFCRAWVNFNGTGTVAIRASFNVSSITDNGAGDYTVNFTNAMADANYAVALGSRAANGDTNSTCSIYFRSVAYSSVQTTSLIRINTGTATTGNSADSDAVQVSIFR